MNIKHKNSDEAMSEPTLCETHIRDINQFGKKARGRKELLSYLSGNELSRKAAIVAKCYDCCGYYDPGRIDCEILECPLHLFMPYSKGKIKVKRVLSERQKQNVKNLVKFRSGRRSSVSGKK